MGTQREVREGTNPDELLVDEGFNAILVGIIQKKFGLRYRLGCGRCIRLGHRSRVDHHRYVRRSRRGGYLEVD